MFSPEFFTGNRQRLASSLSEALMVVSANGLVQRSADTTYPFVQDSNFWYLTGINEPDLLLVIDGDNEYIVLPEREPARDLWEGKVDTNVLRQISGVKEFVSTKQFSARLRAATAKKRTIASPAPLEAYVSAHGFYANPARQKLEDLLLAHKAKTSDCRQAIARLRQLKQAPEMAAIKQAVDISLASFKAVRAEIMSYKTEAEIARAISVEFIGRSADGHAYTPIVASGKHATTLHYVKNDSLVAKNQLLLIDAGAEYLGYASDITRTWAVGQVSELAKTVHQIVADTQKFALSLLKPGVMLRAYEKQVHEYSVDLLVKRKVFTGVLSAQKACPHAISHFLGLDVHDAADYDLPLAENMVLTVEPGVYLPAVGVGVRIEDNVLITKTGIELLSAGLPTGL